MNMNTTYPVEDANNPSNDDEALFITRLFLQIITPILIAFGLTTNTLNIVVLTRKWMHSSTNCYLTALAISDTLYLLAYFAFFIKVYGNLTANLFYMETRPYVIPLANLFSNFSTLITCVFTFERWFAIRFPMLIRKYSIKEKTNVIISIVFIVTTILTFPDVFEKQTVASLDSQNLTEYTNKDRVAVTDFYRSIGYYYCKASIFIFVPLIFLGIFNGLLIRTVIAAKRNQESLNAVSNKVSNYINQGRKCSDQSSSSGLVKKHKKPHKKVHSEQQRITLMLITVVLVFCLFQLPSALLNIKESLERATQIIIISNNRNYVLIAGGISNLLLLLNATLNFLLYSFFSTKFRRTFKKVFLTCKDSELIQFLQDMPADRSPRVSVGDIGRVNVHSVNNVNSVNNGYLTVNVVKHQQSTEGIV